MRPRVANNALIRGFQSWRGFCGFFAKAATGLKVLWMSLLEAFIHILSLLLIRISPTIAK
jgi:hypothetical protein